MLIPTAAAASLAFAATWAMRSFARAVGFVNQPNAIVPQHTKAVAYGGGVGVAVGALVGGLAVGASPVLLAAAALVVVLGLVDDALDLRPAVKFAGQIPPAALVAWEVAPSWTGIAALDLAVATFWGLVLINAVNLTDVCDGLVGGLGAIALGALGFAAGSPVLIVAAAGCLGFLAWNRPPATIYLGDAGSMLIGLLAAFGSLTLLSRPEPGSAVAGAVIPGVFLFELAFLVAVRRMKGLAWWRGSPDHFSLRMQAGPFTRWQTVLVAWGVGGLLAGAGALAAGAGWLEGGIALLVSALLTAGAWRALLRWEVPPKKAA